jgi:hypothetical protein
MMKKISKRKRNKGTITDEVLEYIFLFLCVVAVPWFLLFADVADSWSEETKKGFFGFGCILYSAVFMFSLGMEGTSKSVAAFFKGDASEIADCFNLLSWFLIIYFFIAYGACYLVLWGNLWIIGGIIVALFVIRKLIRIIIRSKKG